MKRFRFTKNYLSVSVLALLCLAQAAAFDEGWQLSLKGQAGGSLTVPSISKSDLGLMATESMKGLLGYGFGGEVQVGYVWDTEKAFALSPGNVFSGIGAFINIGISQGYTGQVARASVMSGGENKIVDVYMNLYYAPVISFSGEGKLYFLDNRLALGLAVGMKMIADTAPQYELYATDPGAVPSSVGTILVDNSMMKRMNPFMATFRLDLEYTVPVISSVDLILGGYVAFSIYKPNYITIPEKLLGMLNAYLEGNGGNPFDPASTPMRSYFINSFDFGLALGLGFRL